MPPLVTIGLPVHNAEPFLDEALRSVFAQTLSDWELIAVDDGSNDGGPAQLNRLDDVRVSVACDGQRRGLGARLNQIVAAAKGKYIARMDADDLMHPERIERQVEFLEQNPGVDLAGCGVVSFDAQHRPVSVRHLPQEHQEITASPTRGFLLAHATVVGRSDWWRQHDYDERLRGCEDIALWLSSHHASRFANLAAPLYFYREAQSYSLRGYVAAKRELASLLWRQRQEYGTAAVVAAAAQWPRMAAYGLAHLTGWDHALVQRRGAAPSEAETRGFYSALERIRATRLPVKETPVSP